MARALDSALNYFSCLALLWGLGTAAVVSTLKAASQAGNGAAWWWWLVLALLFAGLWSYTWFYCGREEPGARHTLEREKRKGVLVAAGGAAEAVGGSQRTNVGMPTDAGRLHWSRSGTSSGSGAETGPR